MTESDRIPVPEFTGIPTRPRARLFARLLMLLLLLLIALGAIWVIDRGATEGLRENQTIAPHVQQRVTNVGNHR